MSKHLVKQISAYFYPVYEIYRLFKAWRRNWQYHRLVKLHSLPVYAETATEALYRDLIAVELFRELRQNARWLDVPVLPVGGAADYKLLYLLLRVLTEFNPTSIIEFGAGQTSKILSAYARHSQADVVTIEHDPIWAEQVRSSLAASSHRLYCCPLITCGSETFGAYQWYDLSGVDSLVAQTFTLFIIDGPVGSARWSRVGIVEKFFDYSSSEWLNQNLQHWNTLAASSKLLACRSFWSSASTSGSA